MPAERLFSSPKNRVFAATVGVLLAAVIVTAAMPVYLPLPQASRVAMPIVLFPVTWLLLFLWVLFARSMWRAWLVLTGITIVHAGLIAAGLGAI